MKVFKFLVFVAVIHLSSCKKFIDIDSPRTDLIKTTVFTSDATAKAAISDIYFKMHFGSFASGDALSYTFVSTIGGDEMINYNTSLETTLKPFSENHLQPTNTLITTWWQDLYSWIYKSNSIIEGLANSSGVSAAMKNQILGEAKFIRAFSHFYLVNLWGDVPLVLTTSYADNTNMGRTPSAEVYEQIVTDLKEAQVLLSNDYSFSANERTRANKWVATALLARVYLYKGEWLKAEEEATKIISNTSLYSLAGDLSTVFNKNNHEAIWQFPSRFGYPRDITAFYVFSTPPTWGGLRTSFVNDFEPGDQRRAVWIGEITGGNQTYYFPVKFHSFVQNTEYSTLFRLAEQYLIRAEARLKLNKLTGANSAVSDIDIIRSRAGLTGSTANTEQTVFDAIQQERRFELFTEWGHRWLDLKRTNKIDAVLSPLKPLWAPTDKLYPIPENQILNSQLVQNPGY